MPEQGGGAVISRDPMLPGNVYVVAADDQSKVGVFRIEVSLVPGGGKLRVPSGLGKGLKESLARAMSYLDSVKDRMGLTPSLVHRDIVVEAVDLAGGHIDPACGVGFYVALVSALQNRNVQPATVILGDLTIQGNLRPVSSILEPLQIALENGALRALLPISNKSQFGALPEEIVEKMDLVFYGDLERAAVKAVDL